MEFKLKSDCISFNNSTSQWPKEYTCTFIQPGLISYEDVDMGKVLVQKPALDKMLNTLIGKPITYSKDHINGMVANDFDKVAQGIVTKAWFDDKTGWYMCSFLAWDDDLKREIEQKKYSVSCGYSVINMVDGGNYNQILYDKEVLDGTYTHIAIVPTPRYNGAKILLNSIGGSMFEKVIGWFSNSQKDDKTGKQQINPDVDSLEINGQRILIKDIVSEVKKSKEFLNRKEINPESTLEIDGMPMTVKEIIECYKNCKNIKNESEGKKDAKPEDKKELGEEMETEEEKKKKKDLKNAEEEEAKKEEEEKEKKKSEKEKEDLKNAINKEHFVSLKNSIKQGQNTPIEEDNSNSVDTFEDKIKRGNERYSSK